MGKRVKQTTTKKITKPTVTKGIQKKPKKPQIEKPEPPQSQRLWDYSKLAVGQYFSCHQYVKLLKKSNSTLYAISSNGDDVEYDLESLTSLCYAASYFDQTVTMPMTQLAEILESV